MKKYIILAAVAMMTALSAHNIPALSPEQQKAIQSLKKQTGKKKKKK